MKRPIKTKATENLIIVKVKIKIKMKNISILMFGVQFLTLRILSRSSTPYEA